MSWFRRKVLRASKIDIKPPTADPDRKPFALVAIVKNEAAYIGDWMRFHAFAGVKDFIIYDNHSDDETVAILNSFSSLNVTIVPWVMNTSAHKPKMILPRQILAYCHAISTFGGSYHRMGFIDADEFLVPVDTTSIVESLKPVQSYRNISLPWVMFGHSAHDNRPPDPVPYAYEQRANHQTGKLLKFKCIVDPCDVIQVSTHKFRTRSMGNSSANMLGKTTSNKTRESGGFVTNAGLQLNHYYLRSKAEMQSKISGTAISGADHEQRKGAILDKARLIEDNPVQDHTARDFLRRLGIGSADDFRRADL
ncbi:MAG: glycosyltransferase family 92 protein [Rhodobacteraceae bacterium]|nr:glycosyltransferase family 92 protein [Paracoccaceae bacterium]